MGFGSAMAQELHGDVTVQGDYLPTLRSHSRISPLPAAPRLSLPEAGLQVASAGVPTHISPVLAPMQAAGWNASKDFSRYRGYLMLGGGSHLDFTGSAGYRFLDTEKSVAGAWLQHTSSTGFRPSSASGEGKAAAARSFDETLGVYGSHTFDGVGTAGLDMKYHVGYFNYYADNVMESPRTQTLNDFTARVWFRSPGRDEGFSWDAVLSDRYFGYRRYYGIMSTESAIEPGTMALYLKPSRENHLRLEGNAAYGFGSGMKGCLGLEADYAGYSKALPLGADVAESEDRKISGYGRVSLTPAFRYADGNFTANAGARFDFTGDMGKEGETMLVSHKDFGHFHVAPDVRLSYRKGKTAVALSATGGVELRTLAAVAELTPYQMPQLPTTLPWFSPLNAALTLDLGSFSGFSARVGMAYKITDNTLPDLLYPALLNGNHAVVGEGAYMPLDVKGWSLQAGIGYSDGKSVKGDVSMSYQPQSGSSGYFNGADRPRWIIDASASVNPWNTLNITLGYEYRGVRSVWFTEPVANVGETTRSLRLNDLTNLSLGADYTFSGRYSVWLKADNILDNHTLITAGMPSQGFGIMGGIGILF